ncbi:hypothetical protein QFZ98_003622 [Paraburkholderia youngii]
MPDDRMVRHDDDFAVGEVLIHRERRDHADLVSGREIDDALAHRIDDAGRLVPEPGRKAHRFDVPVGAPHRFRAIETDRLHIDPNFTAAWAADRFFDESKHFGRTGLGKPDSP